MMPLKSMRQEMDPTLHTFLETYRAAVFAKDVETFVALFERDARIFDLWSDWSYDTSDAWRKNVAQWFGSLGNDHDEVDFYDVQSSVAQDLAVVHAFVTFKAVSAEGKELRAMQERLTWSLIRKSGSWKIAHQHTSAPIDSSNFKVIFRR